MCHLAVLVQHMISVNYALLQYESKKLYLSCPLVFHSFLGFFDVPAKDGTIQCGLVYEVIAKPLLVLVREISYVDEMFFATCWLVSTEGVEKDISLTLPVSRLRPYRHTLARKDKKMASKVAEEQIEKHLLNLRENFSFRKRVRLNSLKSAICREISSAFRSKNQRKTFTIGISCPEIDCDVLGLDALFRKRAVFSHKDNTIQKLDQLLGSGWDVREICGNTSFVTQILFCLKSDYLHGTVHSAVYPGPVDKQQYREDITTYINNARLPFPTDDDNVDTE